MSVKLALLPLQRNPDTSLHRRRRNKHHQASSASPPTPPRPSPIALWLASGLRLSGCTVPHPGRVLPRRPHSQRLNLRWPTTSGWQTWVPTPFPSSPLTDNLVGEFPTGALPQALAFDGRDLWVTTAIGEVIKLSTDGQILSIFNVGGILTSAVFDGRFLWVANATGGEVTKIHPIGGVEAVYDVGVKPVDLLYDGKHLWIANLGNDTIVKLNDNGQVLLTVPVDQPGAMAFDGKNLWATNTGFPVIPGSTVTKLDTNGQQLGVFRTGSNPSAILYADGAIWVANALSDFNVTGTNLSKLSPRRPGALAPTTPALEPLTLAFDGDNLWMVNRINDTVTKLTARGLPHEPPVEASHTPPVERDPAFPRALAKAGIDPNHDLHPWLTDFSIHSVPYDEIGSGGPGRDEIPPLDNPRFRSHYGSGRLASGPGTGTHPGTQRRRQGLPAETPHLA